MKTNKRIEIDLQSIECGNPNVERILKLLGFSYKFVSFKLISKFFLTAQIRANSPVYLQQIAVHVRLNRQIPFCNFSSSFLLNTGFFWRICTRNVASNPKLKPTKIEQYTRHVTFVRIDTKQTIGIDDMEMDHFQRCHCVFHLSAPVITGPIRDH